jgi:hypothetical protein
MFETASSEFQPLSKWTSALNPNSLWDMQHKCCPLPLNDTIHSFFFAFFYFIDNLS